MTDNTLYLLGQDIVEIIQELPRGLVRVSGEKRTGLVARATLRPYSPEKVDPPTASTPASTPAPVTDQTLLTALTVGDLRRIIASHIQEPDDGAGMESAIVVLRGAADMETAGRQFVEQLDAIGGRALLMPSGEVLRGQVTIPIDDLEGHNLTDLIVGLWGGLAPAGDAQVAPATDAEVKEELRSHAARGSGAGAGRPPASRQRPSGDHVTVSSPRHNTRPIRPPATSPQPRPDGIPLENTGDQGAVSNPGAERRGPGTARTTVTSPQHRPGDGGAAAEVNTPQERTDNPQD